MTQVEKARAYEEALKRARLSRLQLLDIGEEATEIEYIFPELKEESEDEKIRKELIDIVAKSPITFAFEDKGKVLAWLEKQGEQNTNHKTMIVKFICKKDWHGIGDYYYGKIYNGYPCEKEQKGYDIYDDNHVPTFCDEDFIDEYFNIITEEKQGEQKPFDYKNQGTQNSHKFNIGDIISNGNVEFRVDNIVKNCVGQDCYFLVDVESEKNGTRYLTMCVRGKTSHMGETTWLCEQVDKSFKKQGEQKPIIKMKSAEESLGIDSETYNKIVDECIYGDDKQKSAWDEEDEHRIKLLEALCEDKLCESVPNSTTYEEMKITIDWINSIKERIIE